MKTIGIKLADGSFYPVLQDNMVSEKNLDLTTAHNNQTKVMVDLYRSATCTMDDAEYVDSLQIENLIAHPNGEPDISFSISLDDNNKLSAKIIDSETGNQSKTTITLVSRTQEERLITDEYNIADSQEKKENTKKAVAGVGLLAAAAALREKENKTEVEFTPAADMDFGSHEESESPSTEPFDKLRDHSESEDAQEEEVQKSPDVVTQIDDSAEVPVEDTSFDMDLPDFPDPSTEPFDRALRQAQEPLRDHSGTTQEPQIDEFSEAPAEEQTFGIDEEQNFEITEEPQVEETIEMPTEETSVDLDLDLPDFPDSSTDTFDELSDHSEPEDEQEEEVQESADVAPETDDFAEAPAEDTSFDLDLPDFPDSSTISETPAGDETIADDDPFALPEDKLASTVEDFPSIEDDFPAIEESSADTFSMDAPVSIDTSSLDDFSTDSITETNFDDTFDIPDVPTEDEVSMDNNDLPDDFFDIEESKSFNDDMPASKGLSFTGLYDKETELGTSSYEEDDTKKKTRAPVIICIICAIICILATLAVLFIIPSKYNLLKKDKNSVVTESPSTSSGTAENLEETETSLVEEEPEPVEVAEPVEAYEAKEEEIVIIEKAEEVVPEQPPVAEEKPKDITYKIKWGDTLWDISETYYKNPWRYKYIARFNNIKNPDHIISGTYITIPAE